VVGGKQLPNNNYAYYWIGGGTADFFHHRINKFRKRMQRKHILYTMYNTKGGHTWRNWRVYFTEYAQTLFWNQR
jgi:enterochelin esterase family protein